MTLTKTTILLALLLATPALAADPAPQKDQTQLRDRVRDPATHPDGTVTPAQDRERDRIREHSQAAAQERSRDRSREMSQARAHEQARSAGGMGQGGATGGRSGFRGGK